MWAGQTAPFFARRKTKKAPRGLFRVRSLSALQVCNLASLAVPLFSVRQGILALGDVWPDFRQFGVQLDEVLHPGRDFVFREDGLRRAFRLAQCAVNALVRVDDQEVRAFVEAVHRTDFHAVGVFAFDAVVGDDEGHF